jgi:sulfate adenylyltransferase subunit 1
MDLVGYQEEVFRDVLSDFESVREKIIIKQISYIPISALNGDNVVNRSEHMPWYKGIPLLEKLETLDTGNEVYNGTLRFPVQTVIRPQNTEYRDYRGYAGRLATGQIEVGNTIRVLPSGLQSRVRSIRSGFTSIEKARAPMSISIELEDDIDISRGDLIVKSQEKTRLEQELDLMVCWLHRKPMREKARYYVRHTTAEYKAIIQEIVHKVDVNTLVKCEDRSPLSMNEIGQVRLKTARPIPVDSYSVNRSSGSLILVDESTHETVAAGMVI